MPIIQPARLAINQRARQQRSTRSDFSPSTAATPTCCSRSIQIVSRRYEKKSIVLTTNLLFRDWSTIFPNAMCATALVERIVDHADVISIQGKSDCRYGSDDYLAALEQLGARPA